MKEQLRLEKQLGKQAASKTPLESSAVFDARERLDKARAASRKADLRGTETAKADAWAEVVAARQRLDELTGEHSQVAPRQEPQPSAPPPPSSLWASPLQAQSSPQAPIPGIGPASPSLVVELERLAALHRDGSLSDSEFEAAKRRLLN